MYFDLTPVLAHWRFLAGGVLVTVELSLLSVGLGLLLGLPIGIARIYASRPLRAILGFYVDTMRAVPLLVVLVWLFFALPLAFGISVTAFCAGVLGLGCHLAAFVSEVVRSGLTSIRAGQRRAALAMGMSEFQTLRHVLLPQAVIRMLPSFGSLLVITIKDSAIASVIAVPELMRQAQVIVGQTYRPVEVFTAVLAAYFLLCWPLARGLDRFYRRVALRGAS